MHAESDKGRGAVDPSEIGIVVYPDVQLAAVHGLTDIFQYAARVAERDGPNARSIRVTHWQVEDDGAPAMICTRDSGGVGAPRPGTLILPPTLTALPTPAVLAMIAKWLAAKHAAGAALASVCSGAFLLAETGLLSGRPASTHWACSGLLKSTFPTISVEPERRMIDGGDVITAGGFMAWVDLGLRLVDRLLGPEVADETGRFLAGEPPAPASPSGFVPVLAHGDEAILRAQHWLHVRDARGVSLSAMAAEARLEKRTFLRRFVRATGMTPLTYCQRLRVARALELLETGRKSVQDIAWAVGYSDAGALARVVRKVTGKSLSALRQEFAARQARDAARPHRQAEGMTMPTSPPAIHERNQITMNLDRTDPNSS